jgi:hypothetical protein
LIAIFACAPRPSAAQELSGEEEVQDPGNARDWSTNGSSQRPAADAGPFSRGRVSLSVNAGTSFVGRSTYLTLGVGGGYYLVNGLELSLGFAAWLFQDPFAATLTPQLKYVMHFVPTVKPYVGTFFRRYFIGDDIDDFNSLGALAGLYFVPNPRFYVGLGAVYEHLLDCNEQLFECDDVYPEFSLLFSL